MTRADDKTGPSAQMLQAVLDGIRVRVFWKDRDLHYLGCNLPFARDMGLASASEVVGKTDHDLIWIEQADAYRADDQRVMETGEPMLQVHEPGRTVDGKDRWMRTSKVPLRDAQGSIVGVLGTYEDVTEQREAEQALVKSEQVLRTILDTLPYPIFAKGADLRYSLTNPAFERYLGKTRDEIVGKSVFEVSPSKLAEVYHRADSELLRSRGRQVYEAKVRFHDGTDHDVVFYKGTFADAQGQVAGMVGHLYDITDRKRIEEALRQANLVVESSPVVVFRWRAAEGWPVELVSENVVQFGYTPAELLSGQVPYASLVHPEDLERVMAEVREYSERGADRFEQEYRIMTKDGRVRWIDDRTVLGRGESGAIEYYQGIIVDITERKLAESQRALLEEQLRHAQKMESVGRLAGGVAHDFNNLLSPILGYSEMLLAKLGQGDPMRDDILQIQRAADRAKDLVQQLLAFGRKQVLALKKMDLRQTIAEVHKMLRRTIREDIRIEVVMPDVATIVSGDRTQLEQVLLNLAINAQDAMPRGGELKLELTNVVLDEAAAREGTGLKAGLWARLRVTDNGVGMDAATLGRLFEPFFTTKETGKGTGLGLSMVYGIIEQHAGVIRAESVYGAGTAFEIFLPRLEEPIAESAPRSAANVEACRGTETILLVEDNDMVRRMAGKMLGQLGYRVEEACDGSHALEVARKLDSIDLLVTDVIMPEMNGMMLYERLREQRLGLRVLYMSGYDRNVIAQHGVLAEGVHFLQKPFSGEMLAAKVREAFDL